MPKYTNLKKHLQERSVQQQHGASNTTPKDIKLKKPEATTGATSSTNLELKDLVITFNQIPRAHKVGNGQHPNHWFFTIHHIPTGDMLHIINPESRSTHTEGPSKILTLAIDAQAEVVLRLLLKAFVTSICTSFSPTVAPWSWATKDEDLAKALGTCMTAAKLRSGLSRISFGNQDHIKIENELWKEESEKFRVIATKTCKKCKKTDCQKLLRCSGCKQVQYCSKECQKADWKQHKKFCQLLRISEEGLPSKSSSQAALDGVTYHSCTWSKNPYIQELAKKIGLKLPANCVVTIVRRLVITGTDTPENMLKFFGKHPTDEENIIDTHYGTRLEILLEPPKGSYFYVFPKSHNLDDDCPAWTPREASEEEESDLEWIAHMQTIIKHYMHAHKRKLSSIDNDDMIVILESVIGIAGWDLEDEKKYYIAALNSLDMGYPGDYNPFVETVDG